jgi:hypothetical protein
MIVTSAEAAAMLHQGITSRLVNETCPIVKPLTESQTCSFYRGDVPGESRYTSVWPTVLNAFSGPRWERFRLATTTRTKYPLDPDRMKVFHHRGRRGEVCEAPRSLPAQWLRAGVAGVRQRIGWATVRRKRIKSGFTRLRIPTTASTPSSRITSRMR